MKVMAFDPGGTTGYAVAWYAVAWKASALAWGELPQEQVWGALEGHAPDVVVVERFNKRPGRPADLEAVEVIGIIREWCRQHGIGLISQTPHQAKHFFTDDRLLERGLWIKGMPHARDALRHLLCFSEFGRGRGRSGATSRVRQTATEPRSEPGRAPRDDGPV